MDEISLIIKAPNQKYEDLKISCKLSWTILELKIYLCKEYPSKPTISDQRLIYSGHLLKDEQCLCDIIQSENESNTYTFHLVCPQRQASTSEQCSKVSTEPAGATPTEMPPQAIGTTFRPATQNDAFPSRTSPSLGDLGSSNNAALHESYNAMMNQYYQYMSYYYLASPPVTDFSSYYAFTNAYMREANPTISTGPTSNAAVGGTNDNVNRVNDNQANADAANVNQRQQNNNNIQADNDEPNRDWTEMLYSFSKAMVMLSIMYFYSSFGRLLLLITIGIALYLYKNARLNGAPNVLHNNNNNEEQENAREPEFQMERANNNENNAESDSLGDADGGNATNEDNGPDNSRYSGLRLVWVFVSSLFTSLIPDPTPIN